MYSACFIIENIFTYIEIKKEKIISEKFFSKNFFQLKPLIHRC